MVSCCEAILILRITGQIMKVYFSTLHYGAVCTHSNVIYYYGRLFGLNDYLDGAVVDNVFKSAVIFIISH